jgi:hypothetical protein
MSQCLQIVQDRCLASIGQPKNEYLEVLLGAEQPIPHSCQISAHEINNNQPTRATLKLSYESRLF